MRLTRSNVARLAVSPGKSELIVFDDELPGFGLRVRLGGKRTWIAQYRVGSKQRRVTLGTTANLAADEARKRAKTVLSAVHLGDDPQARKEEARARASITFGSVVSSYLEHFASQRMRPKTMAETRRYLTVSWRPLHGLGLNRIERRAVALRLSEISRESGPIASNRARVALSAFFNWAMREGISEVNPVIGTNRAADERSRDRVLSDEELAQIWHACRCDDYGRIVRLLMLTGQRREEVGGICGAELNFPRAVWSIPSNRTKNGRPHEVPLTTFAAQILKEAEVTVRNGYLFGEARGSFQGWSKAKAALDRRITLSGKALQPWRLHDIRRTVATRMAELGVQPHIVEAVLNHVSGHRAGVAGVYNRAIYAGEKRRALELWGEHLCALLGSEPAKVIPFQVEPAA